VQPISLSLVILACVFGGALLGLYCRARLPSHHLSAETQGSVKLGMGIVASLAGLVLGLLVASAKSSFDAKDGQLRDMYTKVIVLDRTLARYGPEAQPARKLLRDAFARRVAELWPGRVQRATRLPKLSGSPLEAMQDQVEDLAPITRQQRQLRNAALGQLDDLSQSRWLMFERASTSSVPTPFLVILVFWVTVLFVSFGLFAPRNATVVVALFIGALSVTSAIFLILEMDAPFGGLVHLPSGPAVSTLAQLGR
jgi:hypothetical protein